MGNNASQGTQGSAQGNRQGAANQNVQNGNGGSTVRRPTYRRIARPQGPPLPPIPTGQRIQPSQAFQQQLAPTNQQGIGANEPGVRELIAESVKSALDGMFASNFFQRIAANSNGITAGGKSAKLLNGVGKYNALAWMGGTVQDEVSDMLKVLDGTEHETIKFNQLKAGLESMQWKNQFMQFTLRKETVREFMRHQFDSAPSEKNMMKGFTPFCLQKMDEACEIDLEQLEQYHDGASNLSVADLRSKDSTLKFAPIVNPLDFLAAISNTYALAKVLFTSSSPLTIGLQELQETMVKGHFHDKLRLISSFQPSWFVNVLWKVYDACHVFFSKKISQEELMEGARLRNPLQNLNNIIGEFEEIKRAGVPPSLLPQLFSNQQEGKGKRLLDDAEGGGKIPKKLKWSPKDKEDTRETQYRENPSHNKTLKATKQNIIAKVGRTSMGYVFKAAGQNTAKVMAANNMPNTRCARYSIWGGCGDTTCKLTHDNTQFSQSQVENINAILVEGGNKIASKKAVKSE